MTLVIFVLLLFAGAGVCEQMSLPMQLYKQRKEFVKDYECFQEKGIPPSESCSKILWNASEKERAKRIVCIWDFPGGLPSIVQLVAIDLLKEGKFTNTYFTGVLWFKDKNFGKPWEKLVKECKSLTEKGKTVYTVREDFIEEGRQIKGVHLNINVVIPGVDYELEKDFEIRDPATLSDWKKMVRDAFDWALSQEERVKANIVKEGK